MILKKSQDCVDEIDAQQVFGYALYKDGKNTKLSYPLEKFSSDISDKSFHNGHFIQRMLAKASSLPNVKLQQVTVTSLLEKNGIVKRVHFKTKSGEEFTAKAPLTVICDGCFSNLRRSLCNPKVVDVTDVTELETDKTKLSHIVELDLVYHSLSSSMLGVVAVRYK
ncbi:Squalene monooxygenase [Arachis hypogaea]|uniref:Squalene monooxygenase n=1 Tax=Arachis hypogaea TaxID=3818 RepID=A0A6B9VAI3_ARAHY|nr:Squalene monooxygenase [Arachis hypogaea]